MPRLDSSFSSISPEIGHRLLIQQTSGGFERFRQPAQIGQRVETMIDQVQRGPEREPKRHNGSQYKDENQAVTQPVHRALVFQCIFRLRAHPETAWQAVAESSFGPTWGRLANRRRVAYPPLDKSRQLEAADEYPRSATSQSGQHSSDAGTRDASHGPN